MAQVIAFCLCGVRFLKARRYSLLSVLFLVILAIPNFRRDQDWFTVYVSAASRLQQGDDLFQNQFVYPPINAWLALPYVDMPWISARLAWSAINSLALAVLVIGAWKLSGGGRLEGAPSQGWREHVIFVLGLACGLSSCFDAITNQQTDLFIAALVILGCLALTQNQSLRGLWFGLAAGIKCTPLLWAAYLGWRRKWPAAFLVVVVAVGVNLIPDATHPPASEPRLLVWVNRLLVPLAANEADLGRWACGLGGNQSLAGTLNRALTYDAVWNGQDLDINRKVGCVSPLTAKCLAGCVILMILVPGLVCAGKTASAANWTDGSNHGLERQVVEFGMVLIMMILMSHHSSKPHFCTLLLPGFCIARVVCYRFRIGMTAAFVVALTLLLSSNKDMVGEHIYSWGKWYGVLPAGALLLYAVSGYLLYRPAASIVASAVPPPSDEEDPPLRLAA